MTAYRLPLGRVHQINSSGDPLSGCKLYVYENETTTPVALYSDIDLGSSAANPVVADSTGRLATRFVSTPNKVTLVLKTSADVTVWSDDDIAPLVADYDSILGVIDVATKTALKALTGGVVDAVFMRARATAGDRGGGLFRWDASNLASACSADASEGVYIAPTGQTGSTGAWVRVVHDRTYYVEWFGALWDNSTNDYTAVAAAITACGAAGGGVVQLPPGLGRVGSTIVNTYDFVVIRGCGKYVTGIYATHTDDIYQDGSTSAYADRNELRDLYLYQTSGTGYAVALVNSNTLTLRNVWGQVRNGFKLGTTATAITGAANNGSGLIRITSASHGVATNSFVYVNDVAGTTEANGTWLATRIDANTIDLQGSTFTNAYVATGNPRVGLHCNGLHIYDSDIETNSTYGIDIYSHAGGIFAPGSSVQNKNLTASLPTTGTYGIYWRRQTTAYDRFDYLTGFAGITSYSRQCYQDNTRVVNVELAGCLFDYFLDYAIYLKNDNADWTGAGIEFFHAPGARFGYNNQAQKTWVRVDASSVTCTRLNFAGAHGTATETAIELVGGASSSVSGVFDDLDIDLRPTSGSRHGLSMSAKMGLVRVRGMQLSSTSATYGIDGVNIATGVTGDIVVADVQITGMGGVAITDTDKIAYVQRAPPLRGSATFDPANLADGAGETTTVTVTGAALGDLAAASFSNALQGIIVTAWVSAANTVSVRLQNETTGALDLASGTLRAWVWKL